MSILADGVQSFLCLGLAGALLFDHFTRAGSVTGGDLLLVYWTLKLPAIGHGLTSLAQQRPMQQNTLARLLEPLAAPEEEVGLTASSFLAALFPTDDPCRGPAAPAASIAIADGVVIVAGHTILRDINLMIEPGEHVAIVGSSGAGKSTLVGLLLGWHRLHDRTLRIDGAAIDRRTRDRLQRSTAWVDPAVQVWNRSFVENLATAVRMAA